MPHHACGEFVPALCLFPSTSASHYRPRQMLSSTRLLHFCPLFFKSSLHAIPAERGKDCILSNRGGECWPLSPETDSYGPIIFSLGLPYCAVLTSGLQQFQSDLRHRQCCCPKDHGHVKAVFIYFESDFRHRNGVLVLSSDTEMVF